MKDLENDSARIKETKKEQLFINRNKIDKDKDIDIKKNKPAKFKIMLLIIISLSFFGFFNHYLENQYKYAHTLLRSHKYDESIAKFKQLYIYKDSQNMYKESQYRKAENFRFSNPQKAVDILNEIEAYEKATSLALEISNEINYKESLNFINQGNLDDAKNELERLGDYKDSKLLILNINIMEMENITNPKEFVMNLINQEKYKEAENFILPLIKLDKEYTAILIYSLDKKDIKEGTNSSEEIKKLLLDIDPEYNGFLSKEIRKIASENYGALVLWRKAYDFKHSPSEAANKYGKSKTKPMIGMNSDEVEKSLWGLPNKINRTESIYGIKEQWVYDGNKYVYLENGIVTSIQDSY